MTITVWSDIRCPFCYIAKRKLENAISQFNYKDEVVVEWKSFELDPRLETNTKINTIDYYVSKGASRQQMTDLFSNATRMAKEVGITFNLNEIIVANSFKAHKLVHVAKAVNKQNEAKELLLKAYFTDGENIDDSNVLLQIGEDLGFSKENLEDKLSDKSLEVSIREDQELAKEVGVSGVPFFVFNNKQALSGAQSEETFLEMIKKTY
ncbi:DsbA family oxidoreductase [Tenacibaculum ovolyticum]|uniref:DsbA family oxidoreductase n=1 Tax=Tenacibaculum ovolyticum TaxID=104270 RepID=UPI0022F3E212|nr:DsbA family oxidoreductase [Tenacibaculum ovolyticum]WBX76225.1 DsbA family oxidoreductase [Tenacibaculum ovolyticum]